MAMEKALQKKKKVPKTTIGTDILHLEKEATNLIQYAATIGSVFKNPEIVNNLDDVKLTTQRLSALTRDVKDLYAELTTLRGTYSNMNMTEVDESNFMDLLQIGESYHRWMEKYCGLVEPSLKIITADIEKAASKHEQQGAKNV